jgi:hypothetical protein
MEMEGRGDPLITLASKSRRACVEVMFTSLPPKEGRS